jgi:hypothetical protein
VDSFNIAKKKTNRNLFKYWKGYLLGRQQVFRRLSPFRFFVAVDLFRSAETCSLSIASGEHPSKLGCEVDNSSYVER